MQSTPEKTLSHIADETPSRLPLDNTKSCIRLLAPMDQDEFKTDVINLTKDSALEINGCNVTIIGDGIRDLTEEDLVVFHQAIAESDAPILLDIRAHGGMLNDEHIMQLGENLFVSTKTLVESALKHADDKRVDIISQACESGQFCKNAKLPENVQYLGMSDDAVYTYNIHRLSQTLFKQRMALTADNMLKLSLTQNFDVPVGRGTIPHFCSKNGREGLTALLKERTGKAFTQDEKNYIQQDLTSFFKSPEQLTEIILKIENNEINEKTFQSNTQLYGNALAVVHTVNQYHERRQHTEIQERGDHAPLAMEIYHDLIHIRNHTLYHNFHAGVPKLLRLPVVGFLLAMSDNKDSKNPVRDSVIDMGSEATTLVTMGLVVGHVPAALSLFTSHLVEVGLEKFPSWKDIDKMPRATISERLNYSRMIEARATAELLATPTRATKLISKYVKSIINTMLTHINSPASTVSESKGLAKGQRPNTGWDLLRLESSFKRNTLEDKSVSHWKQGLKSTSAPLKVLPKQNNMPSTKPAKKMVVKVQPENPQLNQKLSTLEENVAQRVAEIKTSLTRRSTIDLNQLSVNLAIGATMASDAGIIAEALNHPHTARLLSGSAAGLGRISSGLSMLSNPATPLMMGGGFLAVGAGIALLSSSLFGKKKDNGLGMAINAIMQALQHLGQMIGQVLQNQARMHGTLQVTLRMVLDLETRIKQQHVETQAFQELIATKDLKDALLSIQGDLDGTNAISLSKKVRAKNLIILEHWLKQHLHSPAINHLAQGFTIPKLAIEILSTTQDPWMIIGFINAQLKLHLGQHVPEKFLSLPPFALFVQTARVFLQGMAKAKLPSDDMGASICADIQKQMDLYQEFIDFLKTNRTIWRAMFDLYEYKRNISGRVIFEVDVANNDRTLNEQVTQDVKRLQLMDALDSMETIRLLLKVMGQYLGGQPDDALIKRINTLESKASILELKGSELHSFRANYHPAIESRDTKSVILALRSGVNATVTYGYGTPMNHIFHALYSTWGNKGENLRYALKLLNSIAKYTSLEANKGSVLDFTYMGAIPFRDTYFRTWWNTNPASRLITNNGDYAAMLLQIAMGYSPNWMGSDGYGSNPTLALLPACVAQGNVQYTETMMILSSTIGNEGVLAAEKLRKAFSYYHAMDRGELRLASEIVIQGIDMNCLLWLTSMLGRWHIFESLPLPVGFNFGKTLGDFQFYYEGHYRFSGCAGHNGMYTTQICSGPVHSTKSSMTTPLMVAAEHGQEQVIEALISKHQAGCDIGLTTQWSDGTSCATRAFERGFFEIAKRLNDLGAPLSSQHSAELAVKGLPGGALVSSSNNEMTELQSLAARAEHSIEEEALRDLSILIKESQILFENVLPPANIVVAETKEELRIKNLEAQLEESNKKADRLAAAVEALLARGGIGMFTQAVNDGATVSIAVKGSGSLEL